MRIFDVPIEPLEERYSSQWIKWFEDYYRKKGIEYIRILPTERLVKDETISRGSFLDVFDTNHFKALQIAELIRMAHEGELGRKGDWVFFHDLWFPGIQALSYIRDGAKLPFKIAGCFHAGTWDSYDFLSKMGMGKWAAAFEESICQIADIIFTATNFHKELIQRFLPSLPELGHKIKATGFPILPKDFVPPGKLNKVPKMIVFPHRLDEEKQPKLFDLLSKVLKQIDPGVICIKSKDVCSTKKAYYTLLTEASIAISFAKQETWGIAMQEALFSGCIPFVPDRLSYQEMYSSKLKFKNFDHLVEILRDILKGGNSTIYQAAMLETGGRLLTIGRYAIQYMMDILFTENS